MQGRERVYLATRAPAGGWSAAPSSPEVRSPSFTLDGAGRALMAGVRLARGKWGDLPAVASGTSSGSFGPVTPLDSGLSARVTVTNTVVAGNARGDAIVAWNRYGPEPRGEGCEQCDRIFARVRRAGGPFGPRVLLGAKQTLAGLRVAMNNRGAAVVAWTGNGSDSHVHARVVSPGGRWSGLETVPDGERWGTVGDFGTDFTTAISPRGDVLLAWAGTSAEGEDDPFGVPVYAAIRRWGSRFARARELGTSIGGNGDQVGHLDAVYTTRGTGLLAWTDGTGGADAQVRVAVFRRGALIERRHLTAGPQDSEVADVAAGPDGQAIVMWRTRSREPEFTFLEPTLLRASLFAGGRFQSPQAVSPPRDHASIDEARLAFDPAHDRATAIWVRRDRRSTIRAASLSTPPLRRHRSAARSYAGVWLHRPGAAS